MLVDLAETVQRAQIGLFLVGMGALPDLHARGDVGADETVQDLQVQGLFLQDCRLHAAANIHAHHVGHHLVMEGHGGADGAALARVGVGHHPDAAVFQEILVAHGGDLRPGRLVDGINKHLGGVVGAFNFNHIVHLSLWGVSFNGIRPFFLSKSAYAAMSR